MIELIKYIFHFLNGYSFVEWCLTIFLAFQIFLGIFMAIVNIIWLFPSKGNQNFTNLSTCFSNTYQYHTNKIDIKFKFQVQIGIELDSLSFLNSLAYVKVPSA